MFDLSSLNCRVPVFEDLTVTDLGALAELAVPIDCDRGDRLLARGTVLDQFYVIAAGRFALTTVFDTGVRQLETTVETKSPGEALGWSALVRPRKSIYSAYCVAPGRVLAFGRDALERVMRVDTGLGYRLMRNVASLVGTRANVLHDLWRAEVEQSHARIKYWMGQEANFQVNPQTPHSNS